MSDVLEFDLVRLTAQTNWPNLHRPGGAPAYDAQQIRACLEQCSKIAATILIAKYCADDTAIDNLRRWALLIGQREWFDNPKYRAKAVAAGEVIRVCEIAVVAWLYPRSPFSINYQSRGKYVGCSADRYKRMFQPLHVWLLQEFDYQENLGESTYRQVKYGSGRDAPRARVNRCQECGASLEPEPNRVRTR